MPATGTAPAGLNNLVTLTTATASETAKFESAFAAVDSHDIENETSVADIEGMIDAVNTQRAVYGSQ